jgi:hypothetical protein
MLPRPLSSSIRDAVNTSDETNALPRLGDIPLLLAEPERGIDRTPSGVPIGLITLQAWQVDSVPRVPASFSGYAAYLIRVTYDLDIEPDAPMPRWFEVGFAFACTGTTVHDALPQHVDLRDEARTYVLNGQLTFTRQDQRVADPVMSDIQLPAVAPEILVFGRGSPKVRWRHIGTADAPIRSGSRTGWVVLLVPSGQRQILVRATARFALPAEQTEGLREMDRPDAFTIDLPERQPVTAHRATTDGPRVFVSYAHDSDEHKKAVKALCDLLKDAGVTVVVDQDEPHDVRRDWHDWMTTGIYRGDYVIVVASAAYRSVGLSELDDRTHSGVQAEYRFLMSMLRESRSTWLPRILPVVLPGHAVSEIPAGLQPYDADHYIVPSLTADDVAGLLRTINHGRPGPTAAL